jgi:hypothetical protein
MMSPPDFLQLTAKSTTYTICFLSCIRSLHFPCQFLCERSQRIISDFLKKENSAILFLGEDAPE